MLIYKSGSRAWGSIGTSVAILEESEWRWKPQLVLHASANASYKLNSTGNTLLTETIDARVGAAVNAFTDSFRGEVGGRISQDIFRMMSLTNN